MRRLVVFLLVAAPTVLVFAGMAAGTKSSAAPAVDHDALVERGRELFLTACSSCHGAQGRGTNQGPILTNVGAAAASFQLTTGRMPLTDPGAQPVRKPPAFRPAEIDALVAFVSSLGHGPPIPNVDIATGNLSRGGTLFRFNCAACHSSTGVGAR